MKLSTKHIKEAYVGLKERIHSFVDSIWIKNVKHTLNTVTYKEFIDFVIDMKPKTLLKLNIYTPLRIIMLGWSMILNEYNEASTASDVRQKVEKDKAVKRLTQNYQCIHLCYKLLSYKPNKDAESLLVTMFAFKANEDRLTMLKRCEARMKGLKMNIESYQKDEAKEKKSMTRKDYSSEFMRLQKWYGQTIPRSILMIDYVAIQNDYLDYIEELKRNNNKDNG